MYRYLMACVAIGTIVLSCTTGGIVVNVTFERLSGLEKDDRVLFENNAVGYVKSVRYNADGTYSVQVAIEEGFVSAATEYSQFRVIEDPERQGRKGVQISTPRKGGERLADGASVVGIPADEDLATRLQRELETGLGVLKERMEQFGRDVQAFPESREYQDLKKSLEELAADLERREKQARERLKKEWLPKIQRELDALRERLREKGREDEMAPLEREVERIRTI